MLTDRYIDLTVEWQDRNTTLCAGRFVDIAHIGAEILNDLEVGRGGKLCFADGKIFHHDGIGIADRGSEFILTAGQNHIGWRHRRIALADFRAPFWEFGHIDRIVIGEGVAPFLRAVRIENNLKGTDDVIILDNDGRH